MWYLGLVWLGSFELRFCATVLEEPEPVGGTNRGFSRIHVHFGRRAKNNFCVNSIATAALPNTPFAQFAWLKSYD
jgi:hypothetical protein